MKKIYLITAIAVAIASSLACMGNGGKNGAKTFTNPVIDRDAPDPTVIRAEDGTFYAYSTQRDGNVPIYKSADMVNWEYIGGAFPKDGVPRFVPKGGIWAPDINYIEGKYVLYFSMSTWGGEWECCIARAVSDSPEGPFTDAKMLFRSKDIGVQNSIDPVVVQDGGRKYLAWGSFSGIYITELTDDGLELDDPKNIVKIAGTAYEGTYIHKRDGYYYLFASIGRCCEGMNSTYETVVGRSRSLFGPYVDKQGRPMTENHHEVLISGDDKVKGPGHDSQIITDDKNQDWIFYHGYTASDNASSGRKMFLDRVTWHDGWPRIGVGGHPTATDAAPVIKNKRK
ncbi:arabinan endo-1,5-alpha-L-arabinosidase [Alistipes sp. Z76]|nr:arabinan endo-1,5-alpha-L-arabinosidase [Alistipes sp. Z76]NCE66845.1 arabinan endo-1,5-alpha-L-arabinosidase [Muribaculaceae bacterium M3]